MKKLILFLLLLAPLLGVAQLNGNFKSVRFVNVTDSTTVSPINGSIYYNTQSNKFRVYQNGSWGDMGSVTPPSAYWATTGTTNLTGAVTINTGVNSLSLIGNGLNGNISLANSNGTNVIGVAESGIAGRGLVAMSGANSGNTEIMTFSMDYYGDAYTAGAIFSDTRTTPRGIQYAADYSANYTDRSLIDKGFADGAYWAFDLDGAYTLASGTRSYQIQKSATNYAELHFNNTGSALESAFRSYGAQASDYYAGLFLYSDNIPSDNHVYLEKKDVNGVTNFSVGLTGSSNHQVVLTSTNTATFNGLEYGADYSALFVDRSLIDKGYADGAYWKTSGNTELSGNVGIYNLDGSQISLLSGTYFGAPSGESSLIMGDDNIQLLSSSDDVTSFASILIQHGDTQPFIQVGGSGLATFEGMTYTADYSAGFVDRSLIDKGFADGAYWSLSGTSTLGANQNTRINQTNSGGENHFIIDGASGFLGANSMLMFTGPLNQSTNHSYVSTTTGVATLVSQAGGGTAFSRLQTTQSNLSLEHKESGLGINLFMDNTGGTIFLDGTRTLKYGADYSANYTARSLIDKGYADATYSGGGGWATTATTTTFTGAPIIDGGASHSLTLTGMPAIVIGDTDDATVWQFNASSDIASYGASTIAASFPEFRFQRQGGATVGVNTTIADTYVMGSFSFSGLATSTQTTAAVRAIVNGTVSSGVIPADLIFLTSATNTAGLTERLRIGSTGNLTHTGSQAIFNNSGDFRVNLGGSGDFSLQKTDEGLSYDGAGLLVSKITASAVTDFTIQAATGISGATAGQDLLINAGDGFGTGITDGGDLILQAGVANSTGVDGEIIFNTLGGTEKLRITEDGRLYGKSLHNNAGAVTGTANQYVASGTYTPTYTGITNMDGATPGQSQWMRVGNVVTVSGTLTSVDATTINTSTEFELSLPIASDFGNDADAGGSFGNGSATTASWTGGSIKSDFTNDRIQFNYYALTTSGQTFFYSYTYLIR